MKLEDLIQIKSELKRFSDTVDEAILLAKNTPGWTGHQGMLYGKNDISGTRMSGAVKRNALDLKYYLTKKIY
jgi:hypothetical protein